MTRDADAPGLSSRRVGRRRVRRTWYWEALFAALSLAVAVLTSASVRRSAVDLEARTLQRQVELHRLTAAQRARQGRPSRSDQAAAMPQLPSLFPGTRVIRRQEAGSWCFVLDPARVPARP